MGVFRKKEGIDVLDLTLLQKKGILKIPKEVLEGHGPDVIDLTQSPKESKFDSLSSFASSEPQSPFGFLDSLAQSAPSEQKSQTNDSDLNALKIKIEDVEFKLERLLDRLAMMESKVSELSPRN